MERADDIETEDGIDETANGIERWYGDSRW